MSDTGMEVKFFAAGAPQTKGSARAFMRPGMRQPVVTNDNPRAKAWQGVVSEAARQAGVVMLQGEIELDLCFLFPRPKGHYRTGKNAHLLREGAPRRPAGKPDGDKCERVVLDALTGLAYADDAQVVRCTWKKEFVGYRGWPHAGVSVRVTSQRSNAAGA